MQDGLFRIKYFDPSIGLGVAFKEYPTDVGPADYGLLVNGQAIGILEAEANQVIKLRPLRSNQQGMLMPSQNITQSPNH